MNSQQLVTKALANEQDCNYHLPSPCSRIPVISVIIPTYNRAHSIGKSINSILIQSYQNFEVIVVDDRSTDNTEEIVKSFNDPRIKYIRHQHNLGAAVARNTGIEKSRGRYIAFLDSDDEWLPHKLTKQVELLEQCKPEVGVVYTGLEIVNEFNQIQRTKVPTYRGYLRNTLLFANVVGTPSTVMVKREYLERVRGFDPDILQFAADADLWVRLSESCEFEVISEVLVRYLESDSDRLSTNPKAVVKSILAFINKHHKNLNLNNLNKEKNNFLVKERAEHLFYTGRLLVCNGFIISDPKAIEMGRRYLFLAFRNNFFKLKPFLYYGISLLGKNAFFNYIQLENNSRKFISSYILKRE
ncbi:glycosyltransferase family 2 protein [Pleurocapsales cyanobacterium LEGE 06147]|nr:glycosyltransferase family 2 protein [Pleurocapsales cyanobacterium LEGE 06147]